MVDSFERPPTAPAAPPTRRWPIWTPASSASASTALRPAEKLYPRAMARHGSGPHRSGDIAETLGRKVAAGAPVRAALIAKGMIYSPAHGDTAFTVPLFDGFMRRIMPGE